MFKLQKKPGHDFTVLNLGDPQVDFDGWGIGLDGHNMIRLTLDELLPRIKPDLITTTGDLTDEYGHNLYEYIINEYLGELGIPWTTVMGNHDQENGVDTHEIMRMLKSAKNCIFDEGPEHLGFGHFTIGIEEEGRLVSAIIMMDSHNRLYTTDADGNEHRYIVPFTEAQIDWYRAQVEMLKAEGCPDSTLIFHIPLHEFAVAWSEAKRHQIKAPTLMPWETEVFNIWNRGYEDSFGINYEDTACHSPDVKLFDEAVRLGHTKNIICGHDHHNSASIVYRGIRLTYSLKTGCGGGGYFDPRQNGCTVLTIGECGVKSIRHEYVDLRKMWYDNRGIYEEE